MLVSSGDGDGEGDGGPADRRDVALADPAAPASASLVAVGPGATAGAPSSPGSFSPGPLAMAAALTALTALTALAALAALAALGGVTADVAGSTVAAAPCVDRSVASAKSAPPATSATPAETAAIAILRLRRVSAPPRRVTDGSIRSALGIVPSFTVVRDAGSTRAAPTAVPDAASSRTRANAAIDS